MTVCGIQHADGVCVMGKCPYVKMCCPAVWDKRKSEPMTNENWFISLSTEEKVSALLMLHEKVRQRMRTDIGGENSFYKGDYYRDWLKEKHNEIC